MDKTKNTLKVNEPTLPAISDCKHPEQWIGNTEIAIVHTWNAKNPAGLRIVMAGIVEKCFSRINLEKGMGKAQILDLIGFLVDKYQTYCIEDFNYFFDQLSQGTYGKLFGRIDFATICEKIQIYDEQRIEIQERKIREGKEIGENIYRAETRRMSEQEQKDSSKKAKKIGEMTDFWKEINKNFGD